MKQTIRLTESELRRMVNRAVNEAVRRPRPNTKTLAESKLRNMIREAVEESLNEMDPRTYASYAQKRQEQANQAEQQGDEDAAYNYQRKANRGVDAARNAWNRQYGHNSENGRDYSQQRMGGTDAFTHNGTAKYGINYRKSDRDSDRNRRYVNYAYNPKDNTEWHGDGSGDSTVRQHEFNTGDNGAHRTAYEMEHGTGNYVKGKGWQ